MRTLLERGDEQPREPVEFAVSRSRWRSRRRRRWGGRRDLPLPDAPGGEACDGQADQHERRGEDRDAADALGPLHPQSSGAKLREPGPPVPRPRRRILGKRRPHRLRHRARHTGQGRGCPRTGRLLRRLPHGSVFVSTAPAAGVGVRSTGRFPVSISPSTIPAAQTSARSSTTAPAACSGAMYAGVPAPHEPSVPSRCARPKSSSFTRLSSQTKTFAGFRSRCRTPREWACASPSAICSAMRSASSTGRGPFSIRFASVSPRSSSITRYAPAGQVPTSWMVTMAGWSSFATASASFWIHSSETGCFERPGFRALSATTRPSWGSNASYTAPKPPRPISRRILVAPDDVTGLERLAPGRGEVLLGGPRDLHEQPGDRPRRSGLPRLARRIRHERPPWSPMLRRR